MMKAMVNSRYGGPDVLELRDVEKPSPKEDEALIHVQAAAINDWDWGILDGRQWIIRLLYGLRKPKISILGCDVAGRIEAVGSKVRRLKVGDEVFGDLCYSGFGGFAEYVCAPESALTAKPPHMSFAEAAAIPQAGALAVQALELANIQPGQQVLINGAGGGVGTLAVQLCKQQDVEVTGVDSAAKLDLMKSVGFDHVIDYAKVDFTNTGERYDFILDPKTDRSPLSYARALKPGGMYVTVGGSMPRVIQGLCMSPWIRQTRKTDSRVLALKPNQGLPYLVELFEAGILKPIIDSQFSLAELPQAFRRFAAAEHRGKIIITQ